MNRIRCGRPIGTSFIAGVLLTTALTIQGCSVTDRLSDPVTAPWHELVEVFRLGGVEPPEPEIFDERVVTLLVDSGERLYVLHPSQGHVAVFGPEGEFLHWIRGGRGDGPGEFTSPQRMGFVGDTLWIQNYSPPRISQFLFDGTHVGTETIQLQTLYPTEAGIQGVSGYLEGGRAWVEPHRPPPALQEGLHPLAALELGTRSMGPEGRDTAITWRSDRGRVRGLPFNRIAEPPFFAVAPDGSAIAVAEWREEAPQSLVLRLVAPDGTERWRRELAVRPDPIQASEHDRLIAEAQELVHRARENLLQMGIRPHIAPTVPSVSEARNILYLPAYRPPVQAIRAGVDGTIWLLLGGGIDGATWLALDDDSDPFLTITLPPGATFGQATRNSLWYFEVDDMGVPYVVRARFSPSATGGLP